MILSTLLMASLSFAHGGNQQIKTGDYYVPVAEQLNEYALFPLTDIEIEHEGDDVEIEYDLPVELTGVVNRIEFKGVVPASGPMILNSNYGKMECPAANDFSNCAVSYKNLNFDDRALTKLLEQISASDDELNKRQLVAQRFRFGGEPHGFVRVK